MGLELVEEFLEALLVLGRGLSKTFRPAASNAQAWWPVLPTSSPHQMSKPLS